MLAYYGLYWKGLTSEIDSSIVNADGFGVAWYTDTKSEFDKKPDGGRYPALYRTTNAKP